MNGKYKHEKELKKQFSLILKKKSLKDGKKYTFAVRAYVGGKWTKIDSRSKVTVRV